jgi:hypothetical protein
MHEQVWVGVMKRIGVAAILVAFVSVGWPAEHAAAQSASSGTSFAQAAPSATPGLSAYEQASRHALL